MIDITGVMTGFIKTPVGIRYTLIVTQKSSLVASTKEHDNAEAADDMHDAHDAGKPCNPKKVSNFSGVWGFPAFS